VTCQRTGQTITKEQSLKFNSWGRLFKAQLRYPRISANFDFIFVAFQQGFLVTFFVLQVLITSNLKLQKTEAMDNTFIREKLSPQLTFNPGLALTGFPTTRPRVGLFESHDIHVHDTTRHTCNKTINLLHFKPSYMYTFFIQRTFIVWEEYYM